MRPSGELFDSGDADDARFHSLPRADKPAPAKGQRPIRFAEYENYTRVVAGLLRGERVDFTYNAISQFTKIERFNDTDGNSGDEVATSIYTYDRQHFELFRQLEVLEPPD